MRIAYVCADPGVPVFGCKGSSVHCQEVLRVFLERGYSVDLFARRLGKDIPSEFSQINVHQIGGKLHRDPALREKSQADSNPVIYQQIENNGPFDFVYERYSLWNCAAMQYASDKQIPGILEANSPLIHEQKTYRTLIDESSAKTIRAKCFKNASSIIAVSQEVACKLQEIYFARHKTTVIPNGVNCTKFGDPMYQPNDESDAINVGFVGTLKPWHGVATLIDSFAMVRKQTSNIKLTIVGDGPEREKLEARVQRFPTEVRNSIHWLGAQPNAEIPRILSTFDIATAPYPDLQDFYFSPLKILEYMAAGLPIVASNIGQIPLLIEHDKSGLLVKSGCVEELASAIDRLCRDGALRQRLRTVASQHANSKHAWNRVVDRILDTIPLQPTHCEVC